MTAPLNTDVAACIRCHDRSVGICCSFHGKELCHRCYRLTHFVEVCIEGCEACAAENLPLILTRTQGVCDCESYDCAGECCGIGRCTCTPAPGDPHPRGDGPAPTVSSDAEVAS